MSANGSPFTDTIATSGETGRISPSPREARAGLAPGESAENEWLLGEVELAEDPTTVATIVTKVSADRQCRYT